MKNLPAPFYKSDSVPVKPRHNAAFIKSAFMEHVQSIFNFIILNKYSD